VQEASLRGQIDATNQLIKIATDVLKLLRTQFEAGQIAESDVLAQQAALAQIEQTLPPLERALAQQRHLLSALTGGLPGPGPAGEVHARGAEAAARPAGQPAVADRSAAARPSRRRGEPAFSKRPDRCRGREPPAGILADRQCRHHGAADRTTVLARRRK